MDQVELLVENFITHILAFALKSGCIFLSQLPFNNTFHASYHVIATFWARKISTKPSLVQKLFWEYIPLERGKILLWPQRIKFSVGFLNLYLYVSWDVFTFEDISTFSDLTLGARDAWSAVKVWNIWSSTRIWNFSAGKFVLVTIRQLLEIFLVSKNKNYFWKVS